MFPSSNCKHVYYIFRGERKATNESYTAGWYFVDEAEEINGINGTDCTVGFGTEQEAIDALDKYTKTFLNDTRVHSSNYFPGSA